MHDRTTAGALRFAAASAVARAVREGGGGMLEPIMKAEVSVPGKYMGPVLNDLTANRRADIHEVDAPGDSGGDVPCAPGMEPILEKRQLRERRSLTVGVPLRELLGYATTLRSLSAGEASFTMEFDSYALMDESTQRAALNEDWG